MSARATRCLSAKCWVDPGPVIKRFQPKDRGKAYSIMKRTSHLVVTLDEREDNEKVRGKVGEIAWRE